MDYFRTICIMETCRCPRVQVRVGDALTACGRLRDAALAFAEALRLQPTNDQLMSRLQVGSKWDL
jgi:hypothetical protein